MMGFMLTPFFNNPKAAGGLGSFLTVIMSLLALLPILTQISTSALWALSLLSPVAFAIAIGQVLSTKQCTLKFLDSANEMVVDCAVQVSVLDIQGGALFSNIWTGQNPIGIALIMLPVDIILYFIITLYLDSVVPGIFVCLFLERIFVNLCFFEHCCYVEQESTVSVNPPYFVFFPHFGVHPRIKMSMKFIFPMNKLTKTLNQ